MPEPIVLPTHGRFKNHTGKTFGHWTVLSYAGRVGADNVHAWLCRCVCGSEVVTRAGHLVEGTSRSCGCERDKAAGDRLRTHGRSKSIEHCAWTCMIDRCENPNFIEYHRYGGRGIKICERWRHSFELFLGDMGPRPADKTSLDRINNDGDYEPGNCQWATAKTQARNTRRNRLVTYQNRTACLAEWAEKAGLPAYLVWQRLYRDQWTIERALTTPQQRQYAK